MVDMAVRDKNLDTMQELGYRSLAHILRTGKPHPNEPRPWKVNGQMYNVLDLPLPRSELERVPRWL